MMFIVVALHLKKTLYNKGKVHKVFVMTLTKTRTKNNF